MLCHSDNPNAYRMDSFRAHGIQGQDKDKKPIRRYHNIVNILCSNHTNSTCIRRLHSYDACCCG